MSRNNLSKVLNELDKEMHDLFAYVKQFSDKELNTKPSPDAWSVNQVIQHLIIGEQAALAHVKKKITYSNGNIKKASAASRLRALLLSTSMRQPLKLTAPANSIVGMEDLADFKVLKNKWIEARLELRTYLNEINEDFLDAELYKHPVVGIMDIWGMLNFFQTHTERHEKQIRKTIRIVEELPDAAERDYQHQFEPQPAPAQRMRRMAMRVK
jgi:hypothetical protein